MSDIMLHGVLNMPIDAWGDTVIDKTQRHATYRRASVRIINSTPNAKIQELIDIYVKSRVVSEVIISDLKKLIKPEGES